MALETVGSNPIYPPHFLFYAVFDAAGLHLGMWPSRLRHQTLTLATVGSSPAIPARPDPLAQSVEHLPFKQGVRGSIPRRVTICRLFLETKVSGFFVFFVELEITPDAGDCTGRIFLWSRIREGTLQNIAALTAEPGFCFWGHPAGILLLCRFVCMPESAGG